MVCMYVAEQYLYSRIVLLLLFGIELNVCDFAQPMNE